MWKRRRLTVRSTTSEAPPPPLALGKCVSPNKAKKLHVYINVRRGLCSSCSLPFHHHLCVSLLLFLSACWAPPPQTQTTCVFADAAQGVTHQHYEITPWRSRSPMGRIPSQIRIRVGEWHRPAALKTHQTHNPKTPKRSGRQAVTCTRKRL